MQLALTLPRHGKDTLFLPSKVGWSVGDRHMEFELFETIENLMGLSFSYILLHLVNIFIEIYL